MNALQVEAEASVLGSCIEKPERLGWVNLTARHFGKPQHARIWGALQRLHDRATPVTDVTLLDEIGDVLSPSEVSKVLMSASVSDEAIQAHVDMLDDALIVRNVVDSIAFLGQCITRGDSGEEVLTRFASELAGCEPRARVAGVTLADAIRQELKTILTDMDRMEKGGTAGVRTGIASLDELVGGLPYRLPSCLAARPGFGKSAVALHIAKAAATAGHPVVVFSYEDGEPDYARRAMASESGIEPRRIRARKLDRAALAALANFPTLARLEELDKIEIVRAHGMTAAEIVRHARARRRELGVELVIVDYLQRMPKAHRQQKKNEAIGENFQTLADFVGTDDLALLALSQISRTGKDGPTMEDLKGSGDIEEIAKLILALHDPGDGDRLEVKILKNSFGPPAKFNISFDRARMRVGNISTRDDEEEHF